ncbi:MAG: hypothetical protein MUC49_10525 [Raineya sp.]|jgi:hypothetical protein|nr:hypothetical protein [Raineya sp.]
MKTFCVILTSFIFSNIFGQKNLHKNIYIEIKRINHVFTYDKNNEKIDKISNKTNRPHLILYLDSLGNIIQKVGYGKHHNADLKLLDFIEQNEFENGKIINTIKYITDYRKNIKTYYRTKYFYNDNKQLIKEKLLYYDKDSLLMQFDYEYDSSNNKIKTILNPTYYYQRTFDKEFKIKSLQQIYDNKLRWEYKYTYTDTTRIGDFKAYYNDGQDYTKKEIRIYKNGKLIEVEEKYIDKDGISSKTVLYYDKLGIIVRIDYFEAYSTNKIYKLKSFTKIKTKLCKKLTTELIKKINKVIYDE